ncbi:unnamed protein product [Polarella glacialis]|uniref:SSD domain-containing protein n=1 Tax=Polarella glacialis TaxID=89957 RepID=A0A813JIM1_POLGL|nr:unnamed protein product [Polarella glacialis]CAE8699206.1 unnamed protein product [Polarella glacialis]
MLRLVTALQEIPGSYLKCIARRPALVLLVWTLVPICFIVTTVLVFGLPELEVDVSTSSYLRADGPISDRWSCLETALQLEAERKEQLLSRKTLLSDKVPRSRNLESQSEREFEASWHIKLYYQAPDIFDPGVLKYIRAFEERLAALPNFGRFCFSQLDANKTCRGPVSAMRFFFGPRKDVERYGSYTNNDNFNNNFNNDDDNNDNTAYYVQPNGAALLPDTLHDPASVIDALGEARFWPQYPEKSYRTTWYFDSKFPKSTAMQSKLLFGLPLAGFSNKLERPLEQQQLHQAFLENELYPLLLQAYEESEVKVNYEGSLLTEYEIKLVLFADAAKATASVLLVYLYMAAYTRAPLVALLGMATVVLSIPVGLALFVVCGHRTIPAINFLVLFLLTGIGADHLFILMDAWRHTKRDHSDLVSRLHLTFRRAGKSIAACGTTTAISFLSNMFSAVRPLRSFGLFVGLCVLANLVLVMCMFPPVLILRQQSKKRAAKHSTVCDEVAAEGACHEETLSASNDDPDIFPYSRAELFFAEKFVPCLVFFRYPVLLGGLLLTAACLALVALETRPSRSLPAFFAPGSHNLGDVPGIRDMFSADRVWTSDMEEVPLQICEGCTWAQDCRWGSWEDWQACSAICGLGQRSRSRAPGVFAGPSGQPCLGNPLELAACYVSCQRSSPPTDQMLDSATADCRWSSWALWGTCDAECGSGLESRNRAQARPQSGSGAACAGYRVDFRNCSQQPPDCRPQCQLSAWEVGGCTTTCGSGLRTMRRHTQVSPAGACDGIPMERQVDCGNPDCNSHPCTYGDWEDADATSGCSASCGLGQKHMIRPVLSSPEGHEWLCYAPSSRERLVLVQCYLQDCPLNTNSNNISNSNSSSCGEALYGDWSDWGVCSRNCSQLPLSLQRTRSKPQNCTNPPEANDHNNSNNNNSSQREDCSQTSTTCTPECLSQGWSQSTSCSTSCGRGVKLERRPANSSAPANCPLERELDCELTPCPVDCALGEWKSASNCSACGGWPSGSRLMLRQVLHFASHGGQSCPSAKSPERRKTERCDCQDQTTTPGPAPEAFVDNDNSNNNSNHSNNNNSNNNNNNNSNSNNNNNNISNNNDSSSRSTRKGGGEALPDSALARVYVVFGLSGRAPLAGLSKAGSLQAGSELLLDAGFDFGSSGAQGAVETLCRQLEQHRQQLAIRSVECFVDDFREYLTVVKGPNYTYPVEPAAEIHSLLRGFLGIRRFGEVWADSIGASGSEAADNRVTWIIIPVVSNIPWNTDPAEAAAWHENWEKFIHERNELHLASSGTGTMYHTSKLWVRFDFETRLVSSTLISAFSSSLFALVAVFLFLGNAALTVYLLLTNMCTIICLAGWMFGILRWEFGAVEAVALIVVVGLSVDYSLHIAECYSQSKGSRYQRTQEALRRTGSALVGAAATSVLACPPILFCTVQVFVRFGTVIISSMVISLCFSIIFLAALLATVGPEDDFGPCGSVLSMAMWIRPPPPADISRVEVDAVGTVVTPGPEEVGKKSEGYSWNNFDTEVKKAKELDSGSGDWDAPALAPTTVRTPTRSRWGATLQTEPSPQALGRHAW